MRGQLIATLDELLRCHGLLVAEGSYTTPLYKVRCDADGVEILPATPAAFKRLYVSLARGTIRLQWGGRFVLSRIARGEEHSFNSARGAGELVAGMLHAAKSIYRCYNRLH